MKNISNKHKLLLIIILVFVLIASASFTYAFFSVVLKEQHPSDEVVTTAYLGEITFQDGPQIDAEEIYPGWVTSKNIVITADENATVVVPYSVSLIINNNTFVCNKIK